MLYIASLLHADDVSLVKLQSRYVPGNSYRKISAEDLRARNSLFRCDDKSMIHQADRIKFSRNLLVRALKNVGIAFSCDMPRVVTTLMFRND